MRFGPQPSRQKEQPLGSGAEGDALLSGRPADGQGSVVTIEVNGEQVEAYAGETVAAALLATGRRALNHAKGDSPRGMFCGMGVCFDCLVTVDGRENVRACRTPVRAGMTVTLPDAGKTGT